MVKSTHIVLELTLTASASKSRLATLQLRMHDHGCAALHAFQLCDVSRCYLCNVSGLSGGSRQLHCQQLIDQSLHASGSA